MTDTAYQYIETDSDLAAVVEQCMAVPVIAIDTEFARFNTYYPIVGLIQIFDGKNCFLIDPLPLEDLGPLQTLLSDPDTLKVFHAGSEDMEVFQYAAGVTPSPVFDSQIASAVLGIGFSMGYQALVEHYLNITLPKDQTRSDWLARPLSKGQLDYAALDVIHLLHIYETQVQQLEAAGKLDWVKAECSMMGVDIPTTTPPEEAYLKLKGLWQLTRPQLAALKAICAWREQTARDENVPRNRIIDQKVLISLVRDDVRHKGELQAAAGLKPRQVRRYGDQLLALIDEARVLPEADFPPLVERTDAPINNRKLKRLRQVVDDQAKKLGVAPELLTKRRHLEKLIRSEDAAGRYHLPDEFDGWRHEAIGKALLSALAE